MKESKLHNYEIVKRTMEVYKDRYLRKVEIADLCKLSVSQVSRIIKAAWRLGWVSRIEVPIHNNCFGEGKLQVIRTTYKIKRIESWSGLMPLYNQVLDKDREKRTEVLKKINEKGQRS